MTTNEEHVCGTCRHHKNNTKSGDWWCTEFDSEYFTDYTDYSDSCEEWEER